MEKRYCISDAAKQVAVETHVLRYWELELNLDIPRNHKGHRYYEAREINLLKNIKYLKESGFQLRAIKMILPNINAICHMEPAKLIPLRDELNQQIQLEEASMNQGHSAQIMPLPGSQNTLSPRNEMMYHQQLPSPPPTSASVQSYPYEATDYPHVEHTAAGNEEKLRQFEAMMRQMIRSTIEEMAEESEARICERITGKLLKELDYLSRQKEELHEKQGKLLQQILSEVQTQLPEVAATTEPAAKVLQSKQSRKKQRKEKKKLFAKTPQ